MYERSYGYKYEEQAGLSNAEVAKKIRADIKVAVNEGLLPDRWKYSVRSRSFAGGCAIDVRVKDCADAWVECDGTKVGSKHYFTDGSGGFTATACGNVWCAAHNDPVYAAHATYHYVLGEEALAARLTLERIHGAYNHDGSDIMTDYFDVNYYGGVDFDDRPADRRP